MARNGGLVEPCHDLLEAGDGGQVEGERDAQDGKQGHQVDNDGRKLGTGSADGGENDEDGAQAQREDDADPMNDAVGDQFGQRELPAAMPPGPNFSVARRDAHGFLLASSMTGKAGIWLNMVDNLVAS